MDDPSDGPYSRPPTLEDVTRICRALNQAGARYVLIGGFAVILHGGVRTTKDIDFLVDASPENVVRVKSALGTLPDNAAAELEDTDVATYRVVRVADEVVVDLMADACGVSYADAIAGVEAMAIEGTQILVANKHVLIRTKKTIRPSDEVDCQYLESRIAAEEKAQRDSPALEV